MHQNASLFRLIGMDKIKPPKELRRSILAGIAKEEYHWAKIYLLLSFLTFSASLAGVVLSVKYLIQSFNESGFYQYASILFSGDTTILIYWRELSYSLVETIPVIGAISFLIALSFLIWSGVHAITNARRFVLSVN